jgi:hypothetical protein
MKRTDNPLHDVLVNTWDLYCQMVAHQHKTEETDEDLRAEANRWDLEDWERDHSEPHEEDATIRRRLEYDRECIDYDSD